MATVTIQRRKKQDGSIAYTVYFVDPYTGKKKYHATFRTLKDVPRLAHDSMQAKLAAYYARD